MKIAVPDAALFFIAIGCCAAAILLDEFSPKLKSSDSYVVLTAIIVWPTPYYLEFLCLVQVLGGIIIFGDFQKHFHGTRLLGQSNEIAQQQGCDTPPTRLPGYANRQQLAFRADKQAKGKTDRLATRHIFA